MADNTIINAPTNPGQSIATKDIGGINHEKVILEFSDGGSGATEVSAANPLPVTGAVSTALNSGVTTVTTAGTRVQTASNACKSVTVKAKLANTGIIYVGGSAVTSANGFQLAAGDTVSFDISNTNLIYIDSSVNTEGISFVFIS